MNKTVIFLRKYKEKKEIRNKCCIYIIEGKKIQANNGKAKLKESRRCILITIMKLKKL